MIRFGFITSVFIFLFITSKTFSQQTVRTTSNGTGYLEHLPPDYSTNTTKKYPVIIFLHGLGERGNGTPAEIQKVKYNGLPRLIETGHNMCFTVNGVQECFIVISPQLTVDQGGWWASYLQPVFDYVLNGSQNYRIDKSRVYLTGLSLGGQGVYIGLGETTDIFAAGATIAGFANGNGCTISERKIPVWGFHGESDGTIPYATGLNEFNRIRSCTTPVPTAELKWTSYPGVGHNSWDLAYSTDHTVQSPLNVFEWLLTKSKTVGTPPPTNAIPVANAGTDQTITLPSNSLDLTGSGKDSDGTIVSYSWTKVSGPAATLTNSDLSKLSLSQLNAGTYVFRLTITDNASASSYDDVTVNVNVAPTASAGTDKTITLPTNTLSIAGAGADSDGTITRYSWSQLSGPIATLNNSNSTILNLTSLVAGIYTFRLTVSDNSSATATDDVTVTVNIAPVADAGLDQTIILPTNAISITGNGVDPDGTISSYLWEEIAKPQVVASQNSVPVSNGIAPAALAIDSRILSLSGLLPGTYVYRLTVSDNLGATAIDEVSIVVKDPNNVLPVSNAGGDQIITLPTSSINLTGSGTDADGTIASYAWTKVSGGVATLANTVGSVLNITGLAAGTYVFRLTVTDNVGATGFDEVMVTVNAAPLPKQVAKMTTGGVGYLEYLPSDYTTNTTKKYPLLIYLHSIGEVGNGSATDLEKLKTYGPPKLIEQGNTMCFTVNGVQECFIVISPQLSATPGGWWPSNLQSIFTYILNGPNNYRIDMSRVYLTGAGNGGNGVYNALGSADVTDVFAAAAVVGGYSNAYPCTISARKVAMWGFHGESDAVHRYDWARSAALNISACTAPLATAEVKWTGYPGVGQYASFDNGFSANHSVQSPLNLYEWLLTKNKVIPGAVLNNVAVTPSAQKRTTTPNGTTEISATEKIVGLSFMSKEYLGEDDAYSIVVFARNGSKIFEGKWDEASYHDIFSESGLYFYHILKNGNRIDAGKVFITN
jgi:predicted peptidase